MKKLILLIFVIGYQSIFAQFDRILISPISKYPSFAGNEGKKRISLGANESNPYSRSSISFDFFSKKLKGAYGFAVDDLSAYGNRLNPYLNSIKSGTFVYSPKLTFKKKEQTWSPAIGFKYQMGSLYAISALDSNYSLYLKYPRKILLSPYLGLSVNTDKIMFAYSFIGQRYSAVLRNNFMVSCKLDRNSSNKVSSTVSSEVELNIFYKKNKFIGFYDSFFYDVNPVALKFRAFYDVKFSKFYLSQGVHLSTQEKKQFYDYSFYETYSEFTYFTSKIGYIGTRLNTYVGLNYGWELSYFKAKQFGLTGTVLGASFSF
jgi:hypothetical protein